MQSLTRHCRRCSSLVAAASAKTNPYEPFVPRHTSASEEDVMKLQHFLDSKQKLTVLTGAGVSTESGLPDYRSEEVGLYARSSSRPVHLKNFMSNVRARKRFWILNFLGWKYFSSLEPNANHVILANWESVGKVNCLVTQNVDRLHIKAGSKEVVELHGTTHYVRCMNCSYFTSRHALQNELMLLNSYLSRRVHENQVRPDGEIEVRLAEEENFTVPSCPDCGGILKPDVVFFGENISEQPVRNVYKKIEESEGLLVLGTSLQVFSGYRFLIHASQLKKPIAIVNIGPTRGDHLASLKIDSKTSDMLKSVTVFSRRWN